MTTQHPYRPKHISLPEACSAFHLSLNRMGRLAIEEQLRPYSFITPDEIPLLQDWEEERGRPDDFERNTQAAAIEHSVNPYDILKLEDQDKIDILPPLDGLKAQPRLPVGPSRIFFNRQELVSLYRKFNLETNSPTLQRPPEPAIIPEQSASPVLEQGSTQASTDCETTNAQKASPSTRVINHTMMIYAMASLLADQFKLSETIDSITLINVCHEAIKKNSNKNSCSMSAEDLANVAAYGLLSMIKKLEKNQQKLLYCGVRNIKRHQLPKPRIPIDWGSDYGLHKEYIPQDKDCLSAIALLRMAISIEGDDMYLCNGDRINNSKIARHVHAYTPKHIKGLAFDTLEDKLQEACPLALDT